VLNVLDGEFRARFHALSLAVPTPDEAAWRM
jgi:stress-induced morphogen